MRFITWNVAHRIRCLAAQVKALRHRKADVVALQEVTATSNAPLLDALAGIGLVHGACSLSLSKTPSRLVGPRSLGVLIASRWPLKVLDSDAFRIPWPEKVLSVVVRAPRTSFEVHAVHVP